MKLVLDMNLSRLWCDHLAGAGFERLHWSQVGDPRATDAEIGPLAKSPESRLTAA